MKLVEAMYLLWHESNNTNHHSPKISEEQLAREKAEWDYYPTNLEAHQFIQPYNVVKLLFEDYDLAVFRDHLYEWLEMALTDTSGYDDQLTAEEVISVYEHLLKLYDAAWIIHQRESGEPQKKKMTVSEARVAELEAKIERAHREMEDTEPATSDIQQDTQTADRSPLALRALYPEPTKAEALGLKKMKEFLLDRFPTIQAIVFIGSFSSPFTYFLTILISDDEKMPEGDLSNKIEDHLRFLANTHIILHKTSAALDALNKGDRFWRQALKQGHFVHRTSDMLLPEIEPMPIQAVIEQAQHQWGCWGKQGLDLLNGAKFFIDLDNGRQAAFTLHRAAETIFKSIIQTVTGYRIQMHNLPRMLRLTLLFTDELRAVFQLDTSEGIQAFEQLKNFHANAHYKEAFTPDTALLNTILTTLQSLYNRANDIQQQFIRQLQHHNS